MNKKEIWLPAFGYEGIYEVSNLGRVKSLPRYKVRSERIINGGLDSKKRYRHVNLRGTDGKIRFFPIHRLVALTFLDNNSNYKFVNHIDKDHKNNKLENLEWCSSRENNTHMRMTMKRTSKYTGVHFDKSRGKYYSTIKIDGKQMFLGRFLDEKEAGNAYLKALHEHGIKNRYASNHSL